MVLKYDKQWGTVWNGEGLWCHDDGLWVTLAKNYGTVTVTGQINNFYCNLHDF